MNIKKHFTNLLDEYTGQTFWCIYMSMISIIKIIQALLFCTNMTDKVQGLFTATAAGPVMILAFALALRRNSKTLHGYLFHAAFLYALLSIITFITGIVTYIYDYDAVSSIASSLFGQCFGFAIVGVIGGLLRLREYKRTHRNI